MAIRGQDQHSGHADRAVHAVHASHDKPSGSGTGGQHTSARHTFRDSDVSESSNRMDVQIETNPSDVCVLSILSNAIQCCPMQSTGAFGRLRVHTFLIHFHSKPDSQYPSKVPNERTIPWIQLNWQLVCIEILVANGMSWMPSDVWPQPFGSRVWLLVHIISWLKPHSFHTLINRSFNTFSR